MPTFQIEITETLQRTIDLQADTADEAIAQVHSAYAQSDIVLDYQDHTDTRITDTQAPTPEEEKQKLIARLVDYLYEDEKRHYAECDETEKAGHIFLVLEGLRGFID
jgi:hypothetical protein